MSNLVEKFRERYARAKSWGAVDVFLSRNEASDLLAHIERLESKNQGWQDCAAIMSRNADFYQGIVRQIGELFGEEARTSDDGSVQEGVLALKVPELVQDLHDTAMSGIDEIQELWVKVERLEAAVRAVKDWDIENFKERGAFVVPQRIRQMIQAATDAEG